MNATWTGMETHPIRLRRSVYDWFFSAAFRKQRRFLMYADAGVRPRKWFMEETVSYLAYKT